jgi:hypothetical protein
MGRYGVAVACGVVGLFVVGSASAAPPSNAHRAVVVKVGHARAFSAARLRPGEKIRCVDAGHVLSVEAPASPAVSNGTVWTQPGTVRFHLHVTARKGGGYVVDCGPGAFHWAAVVAGDKQPGRPAGSFLAI